MKKRSKVSRLFSVLLVVSLLFIVPANTVSAAPAPASSANTAWVYYTKYGDSGYNLWRVKSDGSSAPELASKNYDQSKNKSDELIPSGGFFYYLKDAATNGTLFKIPDAMPAKGQASRTIASDDSVRNFVAGGGNVYYLKENNTNDDSKVGTIMYYPANAPSSVSVQKEFQNMVDASMYTYEDYDNNTQAILPAMFVVGDRLYFNATKDRKLWVASKALDGKTPVVWVAPGTISGSWAAQTIGTSVYLMINTDPTEQELSTKCMVLYQVPLKGGAGQAINPKAPLDYNAVEYGTWLDKYYLFNDGWNGDYDELACKANIIDVTGKVLNVHNSAILEAVASTKADTYILTDGYKTYSFAVIGGKISGKTDLKQDATFAVRSLNNANGTPRITAIFGENGTYTLGNNLKPKQLVGVEWDMCLWQDGVAGIFFINNNDNGKLYRANENGEGVNLVCKDKILQIVYIMPIK